ncbi:MAG: PaaI family thioesterase [Planktomarina sp.]|jgi:acyl-coenzyme A thioesterase PaaI-like protein|nr:PaaI family thioesterase [Planktomarina sp.]MDT2056434.1 PaaI family thioesterase [Planktomarina sp.]MDT2072186.1 PaaI family thioesterase [Planktomarina sp.]MDT2077053.1 PaaI family thioesterase [Planktomarina sp.]HAJ83692.1 thioesterase [Paracoccaceae bacterium]|tara:strand:- start:4238 stop:4738 length:501 start_codon:yes stop_codon:yes gene_type:complete
MKRPEPVIQVKRRRDLALSVIVNQVPYIDFLGVSFDRHGNQLTSTMAFHDDLIGNPMLPALHGGATAAFLEVTAIIGLAWTSLWGEIESESLDIEAVQTGVLALPKTIDFTVDYLRPGLPRDAYARARVNRSGRQYASVHVEAWQDNRDRLFAQASGHFLMPQRDG